MNNFQTGGKIYGKGAKGKVVDIFKNNGEKADQYFTDNIDNIKLSYYDGIQFTTLTSSITQEQLSNFLIKTFTKQEDLIREVLVSNDLNNKNITTEYIEQNSTKYNLLYNNNTRQYGLLKERCQTTLDKYTLTKNPTGISLRKIMEDLLKHVMLLQQNQYTHCDIKADNIMICNGVAKLIDWDKAVYMPEPTQINVCAQDYFGSSTHTSDLVYDFYNDICKKSNKKKLMQQKIAEVVSHRGISEHDKVINSETKDHILKQCKSDNCSILVHCHIDLYALSLVIVEICKNNPTIISHESFNNIFFFIKILQNTIHIDSTSIIYKNSGNKEITFENLLNLTNGYYLELSPQKGGYKQKYLKYKRKYLELKNQKVLNLSHLLN